MDNEVYEKINQLFKGLFENNAVYGIVISEVNGQNRKQIVTININGEYNIFYFFYNKSFFRFHRIIDNQVLQDYSKYLLGITLLKSKLEKNKLKEEEIYWIK